MKYNLCIGITMFTPTLGDMVTIQAKVALNMVEQLGFSIQKQDSTIFHELLPSLDMSKGLHDRASSILKRFIKKCQLDV